MSKKVIMIVDDEIDIINALKLVLDFPDCEILGFTDPIEALKVIKEKNIDVIMCDIRMPTLDGVDLLSMVKQTRPTTKRVVISGTLNVEKAKDVVNRAGIDKIITKPWDNNEVRRIVLNLLKRDSDDLVSDLEREYPGISKIDRDVTTGNIRIDLDEDTT